MNKVILMGRLTRDPELRTTQTGKQVTRMGLAVERRISRANVQPGQQTVDFINLTAWDRTAEFANNYLRKGSQILVEGRLQVRNYDAQDGTKRTATDVIVDNIEFAGPRPRDDAGMDGGYAPQGGGYSQGYATAPAAQHQQPSDTFGGTAITDDDIPF